MNIPSWIFLGPFACLGVLGILTLLVLFIVLRQGRRIIDKQSQISQSAASVNTRWARADLKGEQGNAQPLSATSNCPGCGGENFVQQSICQYCGRNL